MKKILSTTLLFTLLYPSRTYSQLGIGTETPQEMLHINGNLQVTKEISLGGDEQTEGNVGIEGEVMVSRGPGFSPEWKDIAQTDKPTGSVLIINGQLVIAQEITVQLSADYSGQAANSTAIPNPIGNLDHIILDNNNMYTANASTNKFQVTQNGIYEIYLNVMLSTTNNTQPIVGIWDDLAARWISNSNDMHIKNQANQTYTLITVVNLSANRDYSFRATNSANFTIKHLSGGTTGTGPVTQVTLRQLK